MTTDIGAFVFLRPWFLLALLLVPLWLWWRRRRQATGRHWRQSVDAHLLPHLLERSDVRGAGGWSQLPVLLAAVLAILALAGPSWRQTAQPLWQTEAPLVVALDLSSAMRTADLPPSRLAQAKARLQALFEQRSGGQMGLLVYAGDAFTVAPITRDAQTLTALLDSLQPDIMPVEGQRADLAITHAVQMLKASGFSRGDILLVSDHADTAAQAAAATALGDGFALSVLGVGTAAGAPLANARGFVTGSDGKVQLARLDDYSLLALATAGGGRYASLDTQGADLRTLDLLDARGGAGAMRATDGGSEQALARSDDGYWLLLPLLLLVLPLFRRGALLALLLACGAGTALVMPASVRAADPAAGATAQPGATDTPKTPAGGWVAWWQRADQRARQALDAGDAAAARALAQDPALKASAAYRSDDFEAAAQAWGDLPDADAHYNRGNALARAGKLKEALAAYDEALAAQPQMEDAVANRQAVADALKQQQRQQKQDPQQKQDGQQQGEQDPSQQESQDGSPQSGQEQDQQGQPQQSEGQQGQQSGQEQSQSQQDGQQGQQSGDPEQGKDEDGKSPQSGDSDAQSTDPSAADGAEAKDAPSSDKQDPNAAQADQNAREAMREQMQQALEQQQAQQGSADPGAEDAAAQATEQRPLTAEERAELEKSQALQQWLRRVPDDPGSLLRRKFAREYQQRQQDQGDPQ